MKKIYVVLVCMFFILGTLNSSALTKKQSDGLNGNPDSFVLNQNYPNPFNPTTILSYSLKEPARVKLAVYNLVGQEVQVVVDEYQNAGAYEYTFDASSLPTGVYLYKLQVGESSSVKRMTLVK
jgi:hypothetical protein